MKRLSGKRFSRTGNLLRRLKALVALSAVLFTASSDAMAGSTTDEKCYAPMLRKPDLSRTMPAEQQVTILALDSTSASSSVTACDPSKKSVCENLVQDNILWRISDPDNPASKHWLQGNLDKLCACTTDAYATVNCFQVHVNNMGKTWQEAIAICRANH